MLKINYLFSFLFVSFGIISIAQKNLSAQEVLDLKPNGDKAVYDFGNFLSENEAITISQKLSKYFDSTGTQVVVITMNSLEGNDIAQFATELGHRWKIGEAKEDNGVVLILSKEDRKSDIATGYGVEGALPDLTCKRILVEVLRPLFKTGQFYQGIDLTTNVIISALNGEGFKNKGDNPIVVILIIAAIFLFIFFISKNNKGGNFMSSRGSGIFNPGFFIFPGSGGGGGGNNNSGFGGFGGFGGGDFGGGGASSDW
jgi:uncharacterized protein